MSSMSEAHALPPIGGLVGAVRSVFSSVSRPASKVNLDRIAIMLVFFAGVVTILKKNGVEIPQFMVFFGVSLGIAGLLYEMSASRAMMRAFWDAKPFTMFCNVMIWGAAFSFSIFNWIGAAAEGQAEKTNLQKAAYIHSADARTGLEMAEDALKKARQAAQEKHNAAWETIPLVDGQKITDHGQAQAAIDKVKSNTKFWNLTDGCAKTVGPQTRAYCSTYADAKAALAWADTHPALIEAADAADAEVKRLEGELSKARHTAANTSVVTSEERADLFMLTDWGGMSESRAQQLTGLISVLVISIFLSFGSMREEAMQLASRGARTKWNWFFKAKRWFCRVFLGRDPKDVRIIENHHITTDRPFADMLARAGHQAGYGDRGAFA